MVLETCLNVLCLYTHLQESFNYDINHKEKWVLQSSLQSVCSVEIFLFAPINSYCCLKYLTPHLKVKGQNYQIYLQPQICHHQGCFLMSFLWNFDNNTINKCKLNTISIEETNFFLLLVLSSPLHWKVVIDQYQLKRPYPIHQNKVYHHL